MVGLKSVTVRYRIQLKMCLIGTGLVEMEHFCFFFVLTVFMFFIWFLTAFYFDKSHIYLIYSTLYTAVVGFQVLKNKVG